MFLTRSSTVLHFMFTDDNGRHDYWMFLTRSSTYKYVICTPCLEKRDRQCFGCNFDKFRQLFIIIGTNHPDNLYD